MNVEEKKRLRKFLLDHDKTLINFLNPLPLLDKMPYFAKESDAHARIYKAVESPDEQVKIFLDELGKSNEPGTLQYFLDALRATPDQEWLYQLVTGKVPDEDIQKYFYHLENINSIKQVLAIIKPQLKGIKLVEELLDDMSVYLDSKETCFLRNKLKNVGNEIGLFWIFRYLQRKDPKWLKTLYEHVRERRYNDGDSARTTLADALQEYFDFDADKDNDEDMDVDETNTEVATVSHTYTEHETELSNADSPMVLNIPPPTLQDPKINKIDSPMVYNIPPPISQEPKIKKFEESKEAKQLPQLKPLRTDTRFRVGELVRISLEADDLKVLQNDHGGWSSAMSQLIGKEGRVYQISGNGDVQVRYEKRLLKGLQYKAPVWTFNPAALERID